TRMFHVLYALPTRRSSDLNNLLNLSVIITPHWILVFLITLSFLYEEADLQEFIPYDIIFGLLVDIVFTDTLGLYMFAYVLALFTAILLKRLLNVNIIFYLFTNIISLIFTDSFLFIITYYI